MKKILSIALISLISVSSVFAADFSGAATLGLGYNFEKKTFGFSNSPETKIEIKTEYAASTVDKVAEGNVYAGIKASFTITAKASGNGVTFAVDANEVSEAYISNGAWKVSILSAEKGPDYAKSAIDTWYDSVAKANKAVTYAASFTAAPGVTVSFNGWKVGAGFYGDKTADYINYSALVEAPEFDLEGLKLQATVALSDNTVGTDSKNEGKWYLDVTDGKIKQEGADTFKPVTTYTRTVAAGESGKASFANDVLSASVAADFGFGDFTKKFELSNFDVAANVAYAPVTVDAYFNWKAIAKQSAPSKLFSVKVAADLAPLTVSVTGKDLLNAKDLSVEFGYAVSESLSVKANGGYNVKGESWTVGGSASYSTDMYKAAAGFTLKGSKTSKQLYANASIESSSIIPGATVKLAYSPISIPNSRPTAYTTNLFDGKYGKVDASIKIAF